MPYVITEGCVDIMDKSCMEQCPADCIYEGGRMLYINPDECIDCGACEPACPQEAVFHIDLVPEELSDYTAANETFFVEASVRDGGRAAGKINHDAAIVSVLPMRVK